jgi:hypothetical protein
MFINCNWVVTRWQYTFNTNNTQNNTNNNRTTQIKNNVEEKSQGHTKPVMCTGKFSTNLEESSPLTQSTSRYSCCYLDWDSN